jgi:hypothetical protein
MTLRSFRPTLWVLSLLAAAACQQDLTAPGACPATCPGGTPTVRDTVLDALDDGDTTFTGYFTRGVPGAGIRVSNGFLGAVNHGVLVFGSRPDTVPVTDSTWATYTIDSVVLRFSLLNRDTTVSGMRLQFHRLPATTDTTVDFATVDAAITGATLIDSVTIADSIRAGFQYRFVYAGADLAKVALAPGDSGVLAIAVALIGGSTTGVRMGGVTEGTSRFDTYVTVNTTDTTPSVKRQLLVRVAEISDWVSSVEPTFDPDLLRVGTFLGARSLIRFPFPDYLRDSAILARATLELTPTGPFTGLPGDSAYMHVYGIRADFGAKSPPGSLAGLEKMVYGSSDTLRVDVIGEVQLWQLDRLPHPPALLLRHSAEGGNFTEPEFHSTRSAPGARPRLRITYQLPFDFERP